MNGVDLGLGHLSLELGDGWPSHQIGNHYGSASGHAALRDAVAAWEGLNPSEVAITTGASLGLVSTLATLAKPGYVLCPRPYYPLYPIVCGFLALEVKFFDLRIESKWLPDPKQIASLVDNNARAIILNFPGNPTGSYPDTDAVSELAHVLAPFKTLIISDEVYSSFIYTNRTLPDMRACFDVSLLVQLKSFSKIFSMPGERVGYVIATSERLNKISRAHWAFTMSPPATSQAIALSRLRLNPDDHLKKLNVALRENRELAARLLGRCKQVRFLIPEGGIFFWVEIPSCPVDSRTLAVKCAQQAEIIVMPGADFGITSPVYLRASFALDAFNVKKGFQALVKLLQEYN